MSEKKKAKAKKPEVVKSHRQTTREKNFDAARETAVKNHNAGVEQNTVGAEESDKKSK